MADDSIQRKFTDDQRAFDGVVRKETRKDNHAERDGQIIRRSFLADGCRRKVYHNSVTGKMQARILDSGLHALAAFLHGGIRQPNNRHAGQAVGVIHFDFDDDTIKSHYGTGVDAGEHGVILHDNGGCESDIMPRMENQKHPFWTRDSSILLGGFFVTIFLIVYIWWPLAEEYLAYMDWNGPWWLYMDWLLIGVFLFMSLTIVARANLKTDLLIVFVGICGGLAIESWGTQTNLWHYYTAERPPLWIIPAWPIASLSIDRITRFLNWAIEQADMRIKLTDYRPLITTLYWLVFIPFLILMLIFVSPTFDKSYTWLSLMVCVLLIFTPTEHRLAFLTFAAGAGLGYFLELWGTTRECWTYYTFQKPPLFAVLAHGMAAVAFWRAGLLLKMIWGKFLKQSSGHVENMTYNENSTD